MAANGLKQESSWLLDGIVKQDPADLGSRFLATPPQRHDIAGWRDDSVSTTPKCGQPASDGGGGRLCAVCGDRASGSHYRVVSCEGCKGFWRRTVQRNAGGSYACKGGDLACPVTVETRGKCQKCR
jgi:hypothetical protein